MEFGAQGHITENWEVTAGYTYLAPYAIGLVAAGVTGPIPNVAHNQANLWTAYNFDQAMVEGLELGAGLNWAGAPRCRRRYAELTRERSSRRTPHPM